MSKLLYEGSEWDFDTLEKTWEAIDDIGRNQLGLDYYPAQIEIISAEQMIDVCSNHGALPIMYNHWSFGKSFIQEQQGYDRGQRGLAYEVVINTNPSIAYCMENNTMTLQTLVMAHANVGHSHFFKTNYLFKDWSDADSILDYLRYSRDYIAKCEVEHGVDRVEELLDACHSLQLHGVDKYKKPQLKEEIELRKKKAKHDYDEETFDDLWRTVPEAKFNDEVKLERNKSLPEENLLYFLEKNSPVLKLWEKEIVRIVRKISQYFYPQRQTQLMNEGCATFWHYTILNMMFDAGLIDAGSVLEFLKSHSGVIYQPDWNSPHYSGINVYALGFAMMQDIKRICQAPDEEDKRLFPDIAGSDWLQTMKDVVANYRDESFVLQFLSPKVVKQFKLFTISMDESKVFHKVTETHDDDHLIAIRKDLSAQYDLSKRVPHLEVVNVDRDRKLTVHHYEVNEVMLNHEDAFKTGAYLEMLWGYGVEILPVDKDGNEL